MFEKALVYRAGVKSKVDIGLLAETLFFYGNTHLLLDRASVIALVKLMPQEVLIDLFDSEVIQLSYIREAFCVLTAGVPAAHDFGALKLAGTVDGKKIKHYQDDIADALERALGKSTGTKRFAQKIVDRAALHRFRGIEQKEKVVPDLVRADITDATFVHSAVRAALIQLVPGFDPHLTFRFRVFATGKGDFFVDTDLDFQRLNEAYHKVVPPEEGSITVADLLRQIVDARADTFFAAYYMAEPVTDQLSSEIMMLKHFEFLRLRKTNLEDVKLFHELIVPEFPTIREAINSGERSIEDFVKFLEHAEKFKKWLTEANPDVGLIQSYYQEVTRKSWVETLPGKAIRFLVAGATGFTASAATGPIGGLGVGATNTFFLDRLLKGWRPNRFVEGKYKEFVLPQE